VTEAWPVAMRRQEPEFWRAPSAHNTQPWVLRPVAAGLEVGWDPARTLPAGDPSGRDLRLSLGAFIEVCLIVAADAGLATGWGPDFSEPARRAGRLVPTLSPYRSPFTAENVRKRQTNRGPYEASRLPAEVIDLLAADAASAGGTLHHLRGEDVARLLPEADRHLYGTPAVATELREWLRLTPSHPRYEEDGLTDAALGLRRAEAVGLRAILSPAAYPLLRRVGLARLLAATSPKPLGGDQSVLVLESGTAPEEQVELGRSLVRQWLLLSGAGYATHPLSQLIDCDGTRVRLAELAGAEDPVRLLAVFRAGTAAGAAPRSARRRG
jgi:hypothetical protein